MRILHLAALLSAGCSDYEMVDPDDKWAPKPAIVLDPTSIDFGGVASGETAVATLRIGNTGNARLHVQAIDFEGSGAFALAESLGDAEVPPDEWIEVDIAYAPYQALDVATGLVSSDDPVEPTAVVDLRGEGLFPLLEISPDPVEFGDVLVDCSETREVTLTNIGDADLELTAIAQIGSAFALGATPELPLVLAPGGSTTAELVFTPPLEGDIDGELWVSSNEAGGTRKADEVGTGERSAVVEELFLQGDGPWDQIDMFFYVDQSGSMEDNKAKLRSEAESFMEALTELDLDWQVGVATSDDGCLNGGIITPETENAETVFKNGVSGTSGMWTEAGLTVSRNGLQNSAAGECNEGLIREDAKTAIILVSDEPEQSSGSWSDYVSEILAIAPTANISAIAGDMPSGCPTAEAGRGYYEASTATGGQYLSICNDSWGDYLSGITEASVSPPTDTFVLSETPMPDTIEVLVNGEPELHWTYDADQNAIVFDEDYWPAPRAQVAVTYNEYYECPE